MDALPLGWHRVDRLEMQKVYMVQSPRRRDMKFVIGCQSALGLALCCMGVALMQTFHVKNFSNDPKSLDKWHFDLKPDIAWIANIAVGITIFLYGFVGFWLCERKRKLWRINIHLALQVFLTLLTAGSVASIVLFEKDKVGKRIVWSTFIVQGFLLFFQLCGIGDQVAEVYGVYERKSFYRHYNPAMNPEERGFVGGSSRSDDSSS